MARIRSVHPGLFSDEAFVSLTAPSQVFWIGLWTEADDQGVFEWKPVALKMRILPASTTSVDGLLSELLDASCVMKYEIDGRHYGAIRNFQKFQRPKYPKLVHPITPDVGKFIGSSKTIPPIKAVDASSIPRIGEKPSLMERRGEEGEEKKERKEQIPVSDETALFAEGARIFGDGSNGLTAKVKKHCKGDTAEALRIVRQCAGKADPREYVGAIMRNPAAFDDDVYRGVDL